MATPNKETVEYQIILEAQKAITALAELTKSAGSFDSKVKQVTATVQAASKTWGMSLQSTLTTFKTYDKALADAGQNSKIFGEAGKQGWHDVGQAAKSATPHVENFRRSIDAVRIAMGTLVAMAVFRFFNFIESSARSAIDQIKKLETSINNLTNAERIMSEAGIDITFKELTDIVDQLTKKFKGMFPKTEMMEAISDVAIGMKDLGLNAEQMFAVVQAAMVAQIREPDLTLEQATEQTITAILSGRTQALQKLGMAVNEQTVLEKALEMELIKEGEALDTNSKALAIIQLIYEGTSKEADSFSEKQKGLREVTQQLDTAWKNFLGTVGQAIAPVIIPFLESLVFHLQKAVEEFEKFRPQIQTTMAVMAGFAKLATLWLEAKSPAAKFLALRNSLDVFSQGVQEATEYFKMLNEVVDTPTNLEVQEGLDKIDTTKAQEEIEDLLEDLEKLDQKQVRIEAEFIEKQAREFEDHLEDMSRFEEDYQRKRKRIIEDSQKEIKDKEDDYRRKEENDEAKFQERMRQLREQYLFDLEDALRERDARQVLRLMRKYEMDKQNLINENNLRRKEEAERHAQELADIRERAKERLAQLDEEHAVERQRREEDFALKQQRAKEDHEQELEELRRQREARIQEAAKAIAEELGIKGDGVKAIYDMLNSFYGQGGAFDGLYDYTNRSMVARAEQMLEQLRQIAAQAQAYANSMTQGLPNPRTPGVEEIEGGAGSATGSTGGKTGTRKPRAGSIGGRAQGGTFLATRPTTARFGEAGPELASFIPLGRPGASGSRTGASLGQSGGQVVIEMLLSPDLEARVVENTLNKSAEIVAKVVNSKRM